jgi:hypothetical protein
LNDPFKLPSLEEIEQMERQRLQAIQSLEIHDRHVKCQRCGIAIPIVGNFRPRNDRIAILERRIKRIKNYSYPRSDNNKYNKVVKQLKQELAALLEENAKADKLRSLPIYIVEI